MIEKCQDYNIDVLALTVDTITGGNRERDLKTGFTSPPKLTLKSILSFMFSPEWTLNYLLRESFDLPFLSDFVKEGTDIKISVSDYFTNMLDQNMSWKDAENVKKNGGAFSVLKELCLKRMQKKLLILGQMLL